MSEVKRITAQEIASGTPPAAETREAREAHLEQFIRGVLNNPDWSAERFLSNRDQPIVETQDGPEPQAPRVSEEAREWLRVMQQNGAADFVHKWASEILAALSQPAQGECKTEAEENALRILLLWLDDQSVSSADAVETAAIAVAAERAKGSEQSST